MSGNPPARQSSGMNKPAVGERLEQDGKAFLGEMVVMGQDVGDAFLPHRFHRNAIGQAVCLVGAGFVEGKAVLKPLPGLRQHGDRRIGKNAVGLQGGGSAKLGACAAGR